VLKIYSVKNLFYRNKPSVNPGIVPDRNAAMIQGFRNNFLFLIKFLTTGNFTEEQESERKVSPSKWTKALLTLLALMLVFALGGLCALWILCEYN